MKNLQKVVNKKTDKLKYVLLNTKSNVLFSLLNALNTSSFLI